MGARQERGDRKKEGERDRDRTVLHMTAEKNLGRLIPSVPESVLLSH